MESIPTTSSHRNEKKKIFSETDALRDGTSPLKQRKMKEHKPGKQIIREKENYESVLLDSVESIYSDDDDKNVSSKAKLSARGKANEKMTLEYIRNERSQLEEFLFNENNKISKTR